MRSISRAACLLPILAVVGAFCASPVAAQPKAPPPPSSEWRDVAAANGAQFRVIVSVPKGPPPAAGYPVVYVMDGNAWAPLVTDLLRVDSSEAPGQSRADAAVVVGIGYPIDEPFDEMRRMSDLTTPTKAKSWKWASGGYAGLFDFIETVVKPDIERRYRIDKGRQILLGHSLGGQFVLRTLLAHPASFQTYLALSPSIWWDDAALLKDAHAFAPDAALAGKIRVYIGVGAMEEPTDAAYIDALVRRARAYGAKHPEVLAGLTADAFAALQKQAIIGQHMVGRAREMQAILAAKGFRTRLDVFPDEDHFSVVPSELGRAIPFALHPQDAAD